MTLWSPGSSRYGESLDLWEGNYGQMLRKVLSSEYNGGSAIFLNVRRCKNVLSEQNFIYVMSVRYTHL